MKTCNKCNTSKDLNCFQKDARIKDGLQGICNDCRRAKQQQRRAARASGKIATVVKSEKVCNRCQESKPSELFYRDTGCADGLSTLCKECRNLSMTKWRKENRWKYNKSMRDFRAANREWAKNNDLMRSYGITLEVYNKMFEDQKGVCMTCHKPQRGKRPLVVDHDHGTGKVRGLLCYGCNRLMVLLDNPELLASATAYKAKS